MPDKDIDREMANFGLTPEGVDVILANLGNNVVRLPRWKLQNTAKRVSKSGTLVLWLTMFGGDGYYHQKKEQKELAAAGVTQVINLAGTWVAPVSPPPPPLALLLP